jgi:hypothetical protein
LASTGSGHEADEGINLVVREARDQGWTVRRMPGGIWQFSTPDGFLVVLCGCTWSDSYATQNMLSLLIRCGLYWRAEILVFGGPVIL